MVLLSGDGADECFGGYSWYAHLRDVPLVGQEADLASDVSYQDLVPEAERVRGLEILSPQRRAWAWHYYASEREKARVFSADAFEGVCSSLRHFHAFSSATQWSPEDLIRQDREFYFRNEMLQKLDLMTMAYSVEGRVPFAAPSVLSHAGKLKCRHLVRDGTLKWALREAFREVLPADVIDRPKHGFNVPLDHWFRNEWADIVSSTFERGSALWRHTLITGNSQHVVHQMIHSKGRIAGHVVFPFVMLNLWLEENCP